MRTFPFLKLVFFTLAPLLLVSLSAGCSVLDLPDPPTFELNDNDRSCRVDTDCAGVEIVSERGTLLADSVRTGDDGEVACLVVSVICSPIHNVCEAEVRVRDADGDLAFDPTCQGFLFAPFEEDCDDDNEDVRVRDADGDGQVSATCTREPGPDCDDTRGSVRSGATLEICDGFVSDCDLWVGGVSLARPEEDADGDQVAPLGADCEAPPAGSRDLTGGFPKTDCDDTNPFVFPGAPEVCDGFINDCGLGSGPRENEDADGDGFGDPDGDCIDSEAFPKTDCDDTNPATYPGAPEICDRLTNDCNMPQVPRTEEDFDGDGLASFDAPCAAGPIPFGECIAGGDTDPTSRFCPFLERAPGLDEALVAAAAVVFFDYDNDGLGDIVAGSSSPGSLRLYRQVSRGEFVVVPQFNVAAGTIALRTGRLFDDAREDLVVVRPTGSVEVVCNDQLSATGAPQSEVIFPTMPPAGARDAAVVRLSDDQRAVVAITPLTPLLYVARRTVVPMRCAALDAFGETTISLGTGVQPSAVAAGRLIDRATDAEDVVVATTGGELLLLTNSVAGFAGLSPTPTTVATGLGSTLSATVGDFDGDGRLDVAVGSTTGARWVRNTAGTAGGFVATVIPGAPANVVSMHARDINLDGRDDLITVSNTADSVDWWELVGTTWVRHSLVSDFNEASAAVAGDVDGDGDLDVIGAARGADLVTWWATEVTSDTRFIRSKVDRAFDGARSVVAADMNGDQRLDVVGLGTGQVSWWTVMGSAGAPVYTETPVDMLDSGRAMAVADLNGDGANDIVVAVASGVRVLLNNGDGTGWANADTGLGVSGTGVTHLAVGDVTGDGRLDIVGVTPTRVLYWANSGGAIPTFVNSVVGTATNASAVALGDTNGNGRLDIVVSNTEEMGAPGLQVFTRATATAAFTSTTITDAPPAEHVEVGDLDGDGQAEIFSGVFRLESLVAYWSWNGTAYVRHVLSTETGATFTHRLKLADVDGDGDQDLVVAFGTSVVRWLENVNGNDTGWVLHDVTLLGAVGESLAAADFDADGDVDLVVAHAGDSEVVLYKNDGVAWWRPRGR